MERFQNIEYLKKGNLKQKISYKILNEINIFKILQNYKPFLVGTIPLEIDIEKSDLDIVCEISEKTEDEFKNIIFHSFSKYKNFNIKDDFLKNRVIVINFVVDGIEIEIFASKEKSIKTNGYRHMIIEFRILKLADKKFKRKIIELKKLGIKTEPAFAQLLKLKGDSYDALLEYEKLKDEEIKEILDKWSYIN
ncbi:DUF4269 domain-containing protein [Candidatus Cetobacterium colombiensis]|uniref:DUF4269 domain-containing protein n=1 Tax=Candidatus Cetobacterium colombiensis TaxID=3073100 RepID=A0ABU4WAM6_9FUSO|nr:DUF4269 domain-containing protein [Candidatus Cetobacterium colombiensis]MDX8335631.1 DUF4269 domain-containing protein [Candidatus Cetobacterium colombiensis]